MLQNAWVILCALIPLASKNEAGECALQWNLKSMMWFHFCICTANNGPTRNTKCIYAQNPLCLKFAIFQKSIHGSSNPLCLKSAILQKIIHCSRDSDCWLCWTMWKYMYNLHCKQQTNSKFKKNIRSKPNWFDHMCNIEEKLATLRSAIIFVIFGCGSGSNQTD